jgi:hypothetical protein
MMNFGLETKSKSEGVPDQQRILFSTQSCQRQTPNSAALTMPAI